MEPIEWLEAKVEGFRELPDNDRAAIMRNNLFHGEKWRYGIRGQLGNFLHANDALMSAMTAYQQI